MGVVMSMTFRTPAAEGGRAGYALIATAKTWWMAYLTRRIERVLILQLEAMSNRELEDIGLTRSQIEWVVRGAYPERARSRMPRTPGQW